MSDVSNTQKKKNLGKSAKANNQKSNQKEISRVKKRINLKEEF
jgi:hypothetical protein